MSIPVCKGYGTIAFFACQITHLGEYYYQKPKQYWNIQDKAE